MSYQVRHKRFGVYQGSCMGMGFWHPMSEMPEQGFCEFPTREDAEEYVDHLSSPERADALDRAELIVEPFDAAESKRLIVAGQASMAARN